MGKPLKERSFTQDVTERMRRRRYLSQRPPPRPSIIRVRAAPGVGARTGNRSSRPDPRYVPAVVGSNGGQARRAFVVQASARVSFMWDRSYDALCRHHGASCPTATRNAAITASAPRSAAPIAFNSSRDPVVCDIHGPATQPPACRSTRPPRLRIITAASRNAARGGSASIIRPPHAM